jgi:hypothetical protein
MLGYIITLGFCNFYYRFIKNYSYIILPFIALLKGSRNRKAKLG